jgi:hypothetical protein
VASPRVARAIAQADALIDGLLVPPVGSDFLPLSLTRDLTRALRDYNSGR